MSQHDQANHDHGVKPYVIGFILAVILTVIPFWLVMEGALSTGVTLWTIVIFAIVQIVVHLKYFLHLTFTTEEGKLSTMTFLFSALVIVLVVGLSVWIMYASNAMMMG